jgi:hypothetical protein
MRALAAVGCNSTPKDTIAVASSFKTLLGAPGVASEHIHTLGVLQ